MAPIYSRRHFLRQLLGAGTLAATGLDTAFAGIMPFPPQSFRFVFLTDLHLMGEDNANLKSAQGIAACLTAVEALDPKPEFILVGGDLVDKARELTIPQAEQRLGLFQKIWHDHTNLPAYWTFGNHDLVGTSNNDDPVSDRHYGKGLFMDTFHLQHLYYSFDYKGWHFVVLDDVSPQPPNTYIGELFADELKYLSADLDAHKSMPTIVCTHIPMVSNLAFAFNLLQSSQYHPKGMESLICTNGSALTANLPGHNIRAVLAGHLHHYEEMLEIGVPFINSGAVCGNFWRGPLLNCPEGFGVVDLGADGSFDFDYTTYGWNAPV